jgi:hypothetical protein
MEPKSPKEEKSLAEQLAQSLQINETLVERLLTELQSGAVARQTIADAVDHLTTDVGTISRIVRGENGTKGLATRMEFVEKDIRDIKEALDADKQIKTEDARAARRVRWDVVLAIGASVVAILLAVFKKG